MYVYTVRSNSSAEQGHDENSSFVSPRGGRGGGGGAGGISYWPRVVVEHRGTLVNVVQRKWKVCRATYLNQLVWAYYYVVIAPVTILHGY